jgi:3-deoxy-D-manno-octulosonate cytidylyltransferase
MIPARYEASRFPGKLLQDLAGKSVIMRTYEAAIQTNLFDEVYVVTDSDLITNEVENSNGNVIRSKKTHETGSDRIAEASQQITADIIINIQGDEPFINKEILEKLIEVFKSDTNKEVDVASLIFPLENKAAIENPNNVKVVMDNRGFALYFSRAPIPYPREYSEAKYFQHIGVYAFRKQALEKFSKLPMSSLEKAEKLENLRFLAHGMKVKMVQTKHKGVGIDTPEDLEKARVLFKNLQT